MRWNYHVHSRCSFDAEYPLTELCRAAQAAGITELCLTDHCDLIDEYGKPDDSFDWAAEKEELRLARLQYPQMTLRRGVELGEAILRPEAAERVLQEPGIDFVLGSMHNCRSGLDYYWIKFQSEAHCHQLLEEYFGCLLELSRTDYFDALAHLTYPLRYMRDRDGFPVDTAPYDDVIQEILKTLVERGKALEVNTSGYRTAGREPMPPERILRRYRDLGGELITIGTDAHEPAHIASGLSEGMEQIKSCGFRYITLYQNRKPLQQRI